MALKDKVMVMYGRLCLTLRHLCLGFVGTIVERYNNSNNNIPNHQYQKEEQQWQYTPNNADNKNTTLRLCKLKTIGDKRNGSQWETTMQG